MHDREMNFTLELIDLTDDTQVNAGLDITHQLKPPKGFVYEIIDIAYECSTPIGSTAGTHQLNIHMNGMPFYIGLIKALFGSTVSISYSGFGGNSSEVPSNFTDQMDLMRKRLLKATYDRPLDFVYINDTDANKTGNRTLKMIVVKLREAV